jgi:hypothetical protein
LVAALTAEVQKFELETGDLQRKLQASDEKCSQLTQQKQKLVRHFRQGILMSDCFNITYCHSYYSSAAMDYALWHILIRINSEIVTLSDSW